MAVDNATTNESLADDKAAVVAAVKDTLENPAEGVWILTDEWSEVDTPCWGLETVVGDVLIEVTSVDDSDDMHVITHRTTANGALETAGVNSWRVSDTNGWVRAFAEECPDHWRSDDE